MTGHDEKSEIAAISEAQNCRHHHLRFEFANGIEFTLRKRNEAYRSERC
jgi:hypothetical protein